MAEVTPSLKAEDFFQSEEGFLRDYGQILDLDLRRGDPKNPEDGWSFNTENGQLTYNPEWFEAKGYSSAQAMAATLHELEELREFRRDPSLFRADLGRISTKGKGYKIQAVSFRF